MPRPTTRCNEKHGHDHDAPTASAVTGGVDTHADRHVAAAVDQVGGVLGTASPTTPTGYRRLLSWLRSHGDIVAVGIEGTGSYGRWTSLRARGHLGG